MPTSSPQRLTGVSLFLVVTACWVLGLVSAEQDWIEWDDFVLLIATVLSAVCVVLTGYLGRILDAVWLGWIPGAVIMAVGFVIPPPADEPGSALIFLGSLVLIAWPIYFLPLIALGVWLRRRHAAPAQGTTLEEAH
jgi:ABC-type dipeptide/oligopeptide/nickel transport system permease component